MSGRAPNKLRWDLLPVEALEDVVAVANWSLVKHAERDWEREPFLPWGDIFAALMRHFWAFWRGENLDPDSGLPHLAHGIYNALMLLHYLRYSPETDDRSELKRTLVTESVSFARHSALERAKQLIQANEELEQMK